METFLSHGLVISLTVFAMVLGSPNALPGDKNSKPPAPPPNDNYEPGPDSQKHPDVPAGKLFHFVFDKSRI